MTLRVGSIVYATDQGLGILAKSFYDHSIVTDVAIITNGNRTTHTEWYPNHKVHNDPSSLHEFVKTMDIMLFFETPFDWSLIETCRRHNVKTVLMTMYECTPDLIPHQPDLYLCPSLLDLQHFPSGKYLPVPVEVPWKLRTRARTFIHNAGHGGLKGRNGTEELLNSLKYIESPINLIVRSQFPLTIPEIPSHINVTWELNKTISFNELWASGDVFVFPEKFNGLSLPLQEAHASGMLVMATDRFPNNTWLPTAPLIFLQRIRKNRVHYRFREFDEALVSPTVIAHTIDSWYDRDIESYSYLGLDYALHNSWICLTPKYMEVLNALA